MLTSEVHDETLSLVMLMMPTNSATSPGKAASLKPSHTQLSVKPVPQSVTNVVRQDRKLKLPTELPCPNINYLA